MKLVVNAKFKITYPPGIVAYEREAYDDLTALIQDDIVDLQDGVLSLYDVMDAFPETTVTYMIEDDNDGF